jgi:PrcB C-terminal
MLLKHLAPPAVGPYFDTPMRRVLPAFVLLLAAGCSSGTSSQPAPRGRTAPSRETTGQPGSRPESSETSAPQGEAAGIRKLGTFTQSGIETPQRLVIHDDSAYAALWAKLGGGERPAVDFQSEIVVAAAAGSKPTGGYAITIGRAIRQQDSLLVEVVMNSPSPDCRTAQALSQPAQVVAIQSLKAKRVTFLEREKIVGCT